MKNIFDKKVCDELIDRINKLDHTTTAEWGKMDVAQMLAHCCVTYEMVYEDIHPKPNALKRFVLKLLVKPIVTGEKPYKKNSRTAPQFLISDEKVFQNEKERLINYINKTQELGESHFDHKDSHSFGPLTKEEWNNMFYKHLDHHLKQFGT